MRTPREGFFVNFENSDEQCGFGIHLTYLAEEQAIMFGIQFFTLQFVVGYDFTPIDLY